MAQIEKTWHPKFIEYMEFIVSHANYNGLPIKRDAGGALKWIATAKSEVGESRIEWAKARAKKLGIPIEAGVYAKVMYAIHPTKMKACQICGVEMSISYIYPNANFVKAIKKVFPVEVDVYDSIYDVWDTIVELGSDIDALISLVNEKFETDFTSSDSKDDIISKCEKLCRLGGKSHFGPGAMSNFPDRYDGFHTYNRCHRSLEDKGRSAENMKTYTRDRRAYEYWSDGNIHAANRFMGSSIFKGASADHVGPISLGFIHDPRYLRVMSGSDNSAKRDRLSEDIIKEVLKIYQATNVYPMSWYSSEIWEYIVQNYQSEPGRIATDYRIALKKSMSNFMYILKQIIDSGDTGVNFLVKMLIVPKKRDFLFDYTFDALGNIKGSSARNITDRAGGEFVRFTRIALDAVREFNDKENRNVTADLTIQEKAGLRAVIALMGEGRDPEAYSELKKLVRATQARLIDEL